MELRERGLSLIELTVGMAVAVIVMLGLLLVLQHVLRWNETLNARDNEHAAMDALVDRWEAEADSAWAIFTPAHDVRGVANADHHELDFFTRDGRGRDFFWAYTYDPSAHTLQRYLYDQPGSAPQPDGPPTTGVREFDATTYPITALQDATSPLYQPLYTGAPLRAAAVHFGYGPTVAGGNNITQVHVISATYARLLDLTTQTAPSGFTIVYRYTPSPTASQLDPCPGNATPDPSTGSCPTATPAPAIAEATTETEFLSKCDGFPGPAPLPTKTVTYTTVGNLILAVGPPSRNSSYDGPYTFAQLSSFDPGTAVEWTNVKKAQIVKGMC